MSNTQQINLTITTAIKAMVIVLCVIVMGMFIPMTISVLASLLVNVVKFQECIMSVPFWLFTLIFTVISGIIVGEELNK